MLKKILPAVLVSASLVTSSFAFEQQGIQQGNSAVALDVRFQDVEGTETNSIYGSYSYMFTDSVEAGLGLGLTESGGNETTILSPFVQYNVHVSPTVVPYAKVGYTMYEMDSYDTDGYSAEAGAQFFMSEKAAVTVAYSMDTFDDFDIKTLKAGLKVFF